MKKLLISIGSIMMLALVVVLFVNAAGSGKDKKKAATEVKAGVTPAPCSASCGSTEAASASKCQPATCKEANSKTKDTTCDPAACPETKEVAPKENPACGAAASCAETCKAKSGSIK